MPELVAATDLDPAGLYHLIEPADWARSRERGTVEPESLRTEGFVHCSWGHQVAGTVTKHFADVEHLLAVRIDPGRLADGLLIEEDSYGSGQRFPHLYGPLPTAAILESLRILPA